MVSVTMHLPQPLTDVEIEYELKKCLYNFNPALA
jgi:hypothetical protein